MMRDMRKGNGLIAGACWGIPPTTRSYWFRVGPTQEPDDSAVCRENALLFSGRTYARAGWFCSLPWKCTAVFA